MANRVSVTAALFAALSEENADFAHMRAPALPVADLARIEILEETGGATEPAAATVSRRVKARKRQEQRHKRRNWKRAARQVLAYLEGDEEL